MGRAGSGRYYRERSGLGALRPWWSDPGCARRTALSAFIYGMSLHAFGFGYTVPVRARRPTRQRGQDLRDLPLYTIPEAASFLAIPSRTLHYWFLGKHRVYRPAGEYTNYSLLSFRDAAEAYRLFLLRELHGISPAKIRVFLASLRRESKRSHPLLDLDIKVIAKTLYLDKPARGNRERQIINLSGARQLAFGAIVDQFGKRIVQRADKTPLTIYPWRMLNTDAESRPVSIDPDVMSGSLVVSFTRIPVATLYAMRQSGKSVANIAHSYRLPDDDVRKALLHFEKPILKVA